MKQYIIEMISCQNTSLYRTPHDGYSLSVDNARKYSDSVVAHVAAKQLSVLASVLYNKVLSVNIVPVTKDAKGKTRVFDVLETFNVTKWTAPTKGDASGETSDQLMRDSILQKYQRNAENAVLEPEEEEEEVFLSDVSEMELERNGFYVMEA